MWVRALRGRRCHSPPPRLHSVLNSGLLRQNGVCRAGLCAVLAVTVLATTAREREPHNPSAWVIRNGGADRVRALSPRRGQAIRLPAAQAAGWWRRCLEEVPT